MADKITRVDNNHLFIEIAHLIAKQKSTCLSRKVGAVLVKDNHIIASGYNGAPVGAPHCLDIGCVRKKLGCASGERLDLCRAVHAEQNAIIQSAKFGPSCNGAVMYVTNQPCSICANMIVNAGIKKVYYDEGYPSDITKKIFEDSGVELIKV